MLRFSLLGSGSSGNALLVCSGRTKVLVDNGLSFRQLLLRVQGLGESLDNLSAVFITHEHGDHVNGAGILARKLNVPVFMTRRTASALPPKLGLIPRLEVFDAGDDLSIGDLTLSSFSVTHDAADPVSYVVRNGGACLGMATDLGRVTALVRQRLAGCHALVLESNYCPLMLRRGPYPPAIQQRIHGAQGHLSNADMNSLLKQLLHDGLRLVVLVHVSRENNSEDLAYRMAAQVLKHHPAELMIAQQDRPTPLFHVHAPQFAATC